MPPAWLPLTSFPDYRDGGWGHTSFGGIKGLAQPTPCLPLPATHVLPIRHTAQAWKLYVCKHMCVVVWPRIARASESVTIVCTFTYRTKVHVCTELYGTMIVLVTVDVWQLRLEHNKTSGPYACRWFVQLARRVGVLLWMKLCKSVDRYVCVCSLCVPGAEFGEPGRGHSRWAPGRRSSCCLYHTGPTQYCQTYAEPMVCVGFHKPCLGSQVGVGFRRTSLSHPGVISTLLPPTPAWPVQPHKALFMPGGWPGAPEGGWGRRGGSCTHGQGTSGTHLRRPATAALCSGLDTR